MNSQDARDYRRYRWLSAISEHLSAPAGEIWRGLRERFGEAQQEHLDRLRWTAEVLSTSGRSPVSQETFASWSVAEIVRYCAAYTGPEESFDGDSKDGLARVLAETVHARPDEFAVNALEFTAFADDESGRSNPRFVVSFFRGLREWIRATTDRSEHQEYVLTTIATMLTPAVTDLINWIMTQNNAQRGPYVPTWKSARREAASFLLSCLERLTKLPSEAIGSVLESNQESLFSALRSLQGAEDPESEGENDDPLNVCSNSTRGKALHAVIAFQQCWDMWNRSTDRDVMASDRLHEGVAELLEERLRDERSPAVRCVFGWRLPYLYSLSPEWVTRHLNHILPEDDTRLPTWRAAWDAYIAYNQLHEAIWPLLVPHYRLAIARLGQREYTRSGPGNIDARLGAHVFLAWFAGFMEAESILVSLIQHSNDDLRSHVVRFGSGVLETNISKECLLEESQEWGMMKRFWRERVTQEGPFGTTHCESGEAAAFMHWLRYAPSDLRTIRPLIEVTISRFADEQAEWEATVLLECLCDQSTVFPLEAMELVGELAKKAWPRWLTEERRESIIVALQFARGQPDGDEIVRLVVDQLARNHHYEYRRALQDNGEE